jgi:hypothetical protein
MTVLAVIALVLLALLVVGVWRVSNVLGAMARSYVAVEKVRTGREQRLERREGRAR